MFDPTLEKVAVFGLKQEEEGALQDLSVHLTFYKSVEDLKVTHPDLVHDSRNNDVAST